MIRDGLEAGSVADVVELADQGAGSEATRQRWLVDWAGLAGGGLIVAGIVLELVYMFLTYQPAWDGAQELSYLVRNAVPTGVLVVSAVLVVAGSWPTAAPEWPDSRSRRRVCGGLLGAGLCAIYFMTSLVALGYVIAGLEHVVYLPLGLTWWLPAAVGSALSLVRKGGLASVGRPGRPRRADALPLALLAITVGGALVTWLPPWVQFGGPWVCGFLAALIIVYEWLLIRSRPRPRPAADPVTWTEPATPGPADDPPLP